MAWRCHGSTNSEMVDALVHAQLISSSVVEAAFHVIDRLWFFPPRTPATVAYQDSPQPIGYGATISAPHMHAMMAELMAGRGGLEGCSVLDVGSGSGYLTMVLGHMVGASGKVVGIEHVPQLVASSSAILRARQPDWEQCGRVRIVEGDGRMGWPSAAPYNAIHVGAAAPSIPQPLLDQLAPGGRLVIPVGAQNGEQVLYVVERSDDGSSFSKRRECGVMFVPLTDLPRQQKNSL